MGHFRELTAKESSAHEQNIRNRFVLSTHK